MSIRGLAALLGGLLACDEATSGTGGEASASSAASTTASVVSTAGANTSVSSSEASSSTGGACVSGLMQSSPACTTCQDAACCMSATAAATDPGTWTRSAAKICREANCFAECGVAEPECGGIVPSPASCADDLYASCCAEVTACAKSDACTAHVYICIDDRGLAPGSAAFEACVAEFPGGDGLFDALDECFAGVTCT